MGDIIQFPRQKPGRKWSSAEILAIKEPLAPRELARQEQSRVATTKKIESEAGKRDRKRAKRKKAIVNILDGGQQWTVSVLMRLVAKQTDQSVSRTTVTELLKELEAEGRAYNIDQFWWLETDL